MGALTTRTINEGPSSNGAAEGPVQCRHSDDPLRSTCTQRKHTRTEERGSCEDRVLLGAYRGRRTAKERIITRLLITLIMPDARPVLEVSYSSPFSKLFNVKLIMIALEQRSELPEEARTGSSRSLSRSRHDQSLVHTACTQRKCAHPEERGSCKGERVPLGAYRGRRTAKARIAW